MGFFSEQPDRAGIAASVGKMAEGFSRLVTHHIALAKLELAEDARAIGGELGRMAAFVPFVLVGYALLCGALAVVLARWMGMAGGLAVVGLANMVGGGIGIYRAVERLRMRELTTVNSVQELKTSAEALSEGNSTRGSLDGR